MTEKRPEFIPTFVGRQKEMEWLFDHSNAGTKVIAISGAGGVGKTTLVKAFMDNLHTSSRHLIWTIRSHPDQTMVELVGRIDKLYRTQNYPETLAIDEVEGLSGRDISTVVGRLLNIKAIRQLIFVSRGRLKIPHTDSIQLEPFGDTDVEEMLKSLLGGDFSEDIIAKASATTGGSPILLSLLARLLRGRDPQETLRILNGQQYDLQQGLILPNRKLIAEIRPQIISTNASLVERLRQQPQSVYELSPRKFEELVAELLSDLGYMVELTPTSRDGGKDILAYLPTPHGRVLCLVEVKRYRQDRPVGVALIRQLYETLIDADASSAMLVTTSSFTAGAVEFQQKHEYKLALRDYGNVVQWIQDYGVSKSQRTAR